MEFLRTIDEARKFVYLNKVALLAIMNLEMELSKIIYVVLRKLEKISRGRISYAILLINNESPPVITLFINGRQVFEQSDYFGNEKKDLQALKWGIREALKDWGIEPPF